LKIISVSVLEERIRSSLPSNWCKCITRVTLDGVAAIRLYSHSYSI